MILAGLAPHVGQMRGKTYIGAKHVFLESRACVRSTDHKSEPIHFIFGMGVSYGKI